MLPSKTPTGNNNNNHKRQWSEGVMLTDKSSKLYKDDDRQLIQHLVNEYLLEGSNNVLDLIRNCPNECFEALVDFIWNITSQTLESNEDDLLIYNQRSSLLSSLPTNVHRQGARRRLAIIFIEIFKLLSTPIINGGRFDIQRQNRIYSFPANMRQLINFEPDIHGLSCLALATIILINPAIIHSQITVLFDALKYAANQFLKANLSFDTPSTFAVSIYSLFYLLYILYPNNLRRELQPENTQGVSNSEKNTNRAGIDRVLLVLILLPNGTGQSPSVKATPLCYHFKLHPSIVCGTSDNEKHENRWQNEFWQQLIANGDRYVIADDISPLLSNDFKKRKEEKSMDSNRFEIDQVIRMCNEYTESVLHPSETKSQIVKNTIEKQYGKKHSTDCYSNYSDSCCQTYEQQWQTTIQNGQMNLSRVQTPDESNRRSNNTSTTNNNHNNSTNGGTSLKKDSNTSLAVDHNIHAKVQLQLDMLDCNYEQDKREYYAQLIRDSKKTIPIAELDKELKNQEMKYQELINTREQKCPTIHDVRKRIEEFHQMNDTFYNSLSSTQVELKTDDDEHWQQRSLFNEKQSKFKRELYELEQAKISIENEIRELQRRLFQSKQDAKESIEIRDMINKLFIDLVCARKKHQLLHNSLLNIKFKSTNVNKLIELYQDNQQQQQNSLTTDEKKTKFDEYKQVLAKQQMDLTTKRNNFNQIRNMNTHKISIIRRQIDSIRICQTQIYTMNTNSQIIHN